MKKILIIIGVLLLIAALLFGLYKFFWTAENLVDLGDKAMKSEKYERAVFFYEHAVDMAPDKPEYVVSLADAWIADGNYTQAEIALVNALKHSPNATLFVKLSAVYVAQGKLLDAQELLDNLTDPASAATIQSLRPAMPTLSAPAGEYDEYISLSLESDCTIYYTLDGLYPSADDAPYAEPISLPAGDTLLRAISVSPDGLVSPLLEAEYKIVGVVEPITFASPELEAYVRELLYVARTDDVTTEDAWKLTELTVPEDVTELSDLRHFTKLQHLVINDCPASDYTFLSSLTSLSTLDLSGCILPEDAVAAIGTLSELTELKLRSCGLSSIEPLTPLAKLTVLDLSDNSISDIAAIVDDNTLHSLNLSKNALTVLDALSKLTSLVELDISGNTISSLVPISACIKLQTLLVNDNQIADLSPIAQMADLLVFNAADNNLTDSSPLNECRKLTRLILSGNALTFVDGIAHMPDLTYLDINHNAITALPVLDVKVFHLQQIDASYNQLTDVSPLIGLQQLTYLNIDYNTGIEKITDLTACPLLVQIDCFGTKVTEAQALIDMGVIVNYDPTSVSAE